MKKQQSKTVVVIDDDPDDLEVMKEALSHVDAKLVCLSFTDSNEALRLLVKDQIILPDFIFIDINMPQTDGFTCLRQLRAVPVFGHVPIIIYSTHMPSEQSMKLFNSGASFTFEKPSLYSHYLPILEAIILKSGYHRKVSVNPLAMS